jgi:multidrug transporter EmrE-like cation transporter
MEGGEMNWAILVFAGVFEIGWAIGLKYTEGSPDCGLASGQF